MEVTTQPKAYAAKNFQTSLFSCCDDVGVCCCGTFCLPCLGCSIASDMNECCACGLGMHMRSVYRERYNIPGSMCNDCVVNYFCACCASCQLKRDINIRKSNGEF